MRALSLLCLLAPLCLTACERSGPCAAYDRTAEAHKGGAYIRYCVDRKGRAQGPYLCKRDDGRGRVVGTHLDGKRHGTWSFRGEGDRLVRVERWVNDSKEMVDERNPELPPLPEEISRVDCDGQLIRRRPKAP